MAETTVRVVPTTEAPDHLLAEIHALMVDAFEGDFSADDWEHTVGGWHVVVAEGPMLVAHAAVVPRVIEVGDRRLSTGYVEGVATSPSRQRQGLGARAMATATEFIRHECEMGVLSTGQYEFYARLGWEPWRGPTYVRDGDTVIRSEADDDGIMVLRFGPSRDLDLAAPITCRARAGDDW